MAGQRVNILFPVGRLVQGDLYEPQTTGADGQLLTIKTGPNAGQSRVSYFFALAIPKGGEQHWSQTPWGAEIWKAGHAFLPNASQLGEHFAWKVTDGDSATPGKPVNGKPTAAPRERTGFPGHWVVRFSGGFAPSIHNADGSETWVEKGRVKCGYYVQVYGNVEANGSSQNPGVYVNHSMVSFQAFGEEISSGPDAGAVGFGQGVALPHGASSAPPAGAFNPGAPPPAAQYTPPPPPAAAPPAAQYTPPPPPGNVQPHTEFLNPPPPPGAGSAPPSHSGAPGNPAHAAPLTYAAPPPPASPPTYPTNPQMTAKANGQPYEAFKAAGWTDDALRQQGYIL